ncbi:MAG: hypothetical protein WKF66_13285 [Pedobacter sp.]
MILTRHSVVLEEKTNTYSIPTPTAIDYIDVSVDGKFLIEGNDFSIEQDMDLTLYFTPTIKANSTLLINYELMDEKEFPSFLYEEEETSYFQKMKNIFNKSLAGLKSFTFNGPRV